jgi:hypothetical protein
MATSENTVRTPKAQRWGTRAQLDEARVEIVALKVENKRLREGVSAAEAKASAEVATEVQWRKDQKKVDRSKLKAEVDGREKAAKVAKVAAEKAQLKLEGLQARMAHLVSTRADQAAKWLTQREEMKTMHRRRQGCGVVCGAAGGDAGATGPGGQPAAQS